MHDKFKAFVDQDSDIKHRLKNFTDQMYQLLILAELDISGFYITEIDGYGKYFGAFVYLQTLILGTIYDLIYAFIYCTNNGIGDGEFTTEVPTTTSTSTTTVSHFLSIDN